MVAVDNGVLLQTGDSTPDYAFSDGRPPVKLAGLFTNASETLQGPAGRVWVLTYSDQPPFDSIATLVDSRGRRVGPRLVSSGTYKSDGHGGLLLTDVGGVWQAYPQPIRQVTTGSIPAVGANHYQLLEYDTQHQCRNTLLDRRTGHHINLNARDRRWTDTLLSSSGVWAATVRGYDGNQEPQTTVVRVSDDTTLTTLADPPEPMPGTPRSIGWLSDQWLTAIADGRLVLYNTSTRKVTTPDLDLSDLLQLTWRPKSP